MAQRYSGRLELTWTNKDLRLLAHEDGMYEWVPPADYRVAEVRLLRDAGSVGGVGGTRSRARENLLIRGDALNALTSLSELPEFADQIAGQVRLIYIDPPFNTQESWLQYDDALEHSVWLTMMRDRVAQAKKLLASNGSIWVHLNDAEMAYCRILLDEVFGRENFVGVVIWQKADSPRNSARHFSTDHEYLLVYARDAESWRPNKLHRSDEANASYTNPDDDPRGPWLSGDLRANKPYSKGLYTVTGPTGRTFDPPPGRFWRISKEKFDELDADGRVWWGPKGEALPTLKRFLSEVGNLVPRTLWFNEDVGSNRTSKNEIKALIPGREPFSTPKPERLMRRIIEIASDPGDIVVDCFLGSGTTTAVAHKIGRRWVGVEWSADTLETFAIPRLSKVVTGEDEGGISSDVGWEGGGGFRILDVGPSMFEEDSGVVVLADWATDSALAEATAAQLHYDFSPDPPFCGRKGRSRLCVIDGIVNEDVVRLLVNSLGDDERLTVCATSVDPRAADVLRELRPGSRVRKIPASILAEYRESQWRPAASTNASGNGADPGAEAAPRVAR